MTYRRASAVTPPPGRTAPQPPPRLRHLPHGLSRERYEVRSGTPKLCMRASGALHPGRTRAAVARRNPTAAPLPPTHESRAGDTSAFSQTERGRCGTRNPRPERRNSRELPSTARPHCRLKHRRPCLPNRDARPNSAWPAPLATVPDGAPCRHGHPMSESGLNGIGRRIRELRRREGGDICAGSGTPYCACVARNIAGTEAEPQALGGFMLTAASRAGTGKAASQVLASGFVAEQCSQHGYETDHQADGIQMES